MVLPNSKGGNLTTGRDGPTASVLTPIGQNTRASTLLVFVPGLAGNERQWELVLPQLDDLPADRAYGAPLLPHPVFCGGKVTARALAQAYADELRSEGLRNVIIVAHSVGTFVALSVASIAPDIVKEVIAVNGGLMIPAKFLDHPWQTFRERPWDCLHALRLFALVGTPALPAVKRAIANSERLSRAVFGGLVSDAVLNSVERRRILAGEGGEPRAMQTLWYNRHYWQEFSSYSDDIKSRCLFLAGDRDPIAGVSDTEHMAALLQNAEVNIKTMKGVGHAGPVEDPEYVSAEIRESLAALPLG
jgi:pimeloyl-ACP methyl ester carboxylesterase